MFRQQQSTPDAGARTLPLTPAAYQKLEQELARLRRERDGHAESLRLAREFGEPSGNDELMAVREEEPIIAARLARLEAIIARAEIVEGNGSADRVAIGSTVTLLDQASGRTESYIIDGAHGSMDSNVVSALSPMGSALIGAETGAVVDVELPSGRVRTFTVLEVAQSA